jgi:hypothetical protein
MANRTPQWLKSSTVDITGKFKTEREMCDYLEQIIDIFSTDIVGEPLIEYKREYHLKTDYLKGKSGSPRVDFFIKTNSHNVFIEVKNCKEFRQHSWAIGQLLAYGAESDIDITKLILVTSSINDITVNTILKYELPIELSLFTKDYLGKWNTKLNKELSRG